MGHQGTHIAVLGAGILGLSIAERLLRDGLDVTLHEPKALPPHNASWKAGGMLAPYSEIDHMDLAWVEAGLDAIDIWAEFHAHNDIGFHQNGSIFVAHEPDAYILERFAKHMPGELGQMQDLSTALPHLNARFKEGLILNEEAHLDPHKAMCVMLNRLADDGVTNKQDAPRPQDIQNQYDTVIDCRGFFAVKDQPELRGIKGELAFVRNTDFTLPCPLRLMHPRYPLYIVPRPDHVFMIGATMIESADEARAEAISLKSGMELFSALYSLDKSFGDADILSIHADIRPAYRDNLPRITRAGNIIHANGLFRHGFLFSPIMAEAVACMIAEKDYKYNALLMTRGNTDGQDQDQQRRTKLRGAA